MQTKGREDNDHCVPRGGVEHPPRKHRHPLPKVSKNEPIHLPGNGLDLAPLVDSPIYLAHGGEGAGLTAVSDDPT